MSNSLSEEQLEKIEILNAIMKSSLYSQHLERYNKTKNPAYLWECITVCIENNLPLPEICNVYLLSVANSLIYEEYDNTVKLPNILKKSLCFTNKTQLNEIRERQKSLEKHNKIAETMIMKGVSKNQALDILTELTKAGQNDKHLNSKVTAAYIAALEDILEQCKPREVIPLYGGLYKSIYIIGKKLLQDKNSEVLVSIFSDLIKILNESTLSYEYYSNKQELIIDVERLGLSIENKLKEWGEKNLLNLDTIEMLNPLINSLEKIGQIIKKDGHHEKSKLIS